MTPIASAAAHAAATLPLFTPSPRTDTASSLLQAAATLMEALAKGQALDARALRAAMEAAFGASDAAGAFANSPPGSRLSRHLRRADCLVADLK